MGPVRLLAFVLGALAIACASLPGQQATTTPSSSTTQRPTRSPAPSVDGAFAACSAITNDIPLIEVKTGMATLDAAYEVTGEQMTNYFRAFLDAGPGSNGSSWWNNADRIVDMCIFDGDFFAMNPGPQGHETNATRVLVVIDGSDAFSWAYCFKNAAVCAISDTDPATITNAW